MRLRSERSENGESQKSSSKKTKPIKKFAIKQLEAEDMDEHSLSNPCLMRQEESISPSKDQPLNFVNEEQMQVASPTKGQKSVSKAKRTARAPAKGKRVTKKKT